MRWPLAKKFERGVERTDECWLWRRTKHSGIYGRLLLDGKMVYAHRVSWFLKYGTWPKGVLLHSCDNPPCVNPDHLRDGTQLDNIADAVSKRSWARGESHWGVKLSDGDVDRIRDLLACGVAQRAIASHIGCSQQHVSQINRRMVRT